MIPEGQSPSWHYPTGMVAGARSWELSSSNTSMKKKEQIEGFLLSESGPSEELLPARLHHLNHPPKQRLQLETRCLGAWDCGDVCPSNHLSLKLLLLGYLISDEEINICVSFACSIMSWNYTDYPITDIFTTCIPIVASPFLSFILFFFPTKT